MSALSLAGAAHMESELRNTTNQSQSSLADTGMAEAIPVKLELRK